MFINPSVTYEFENNLTLEKLKIDEFNTLCEKLEINYKMKEKILKIRGEKKFNNPISNYFSKKIINN